jgi:histidyl-tRNA synthetase
LFHGKCEIGKESDAVSAVGFGFGDAVIVELLKMKNLLPDFSKPDVSVIVFALDESRRPQAIEAASLLRKNGIVADLILESKKMKWMLQRAERIGAGNLI